MSCIAMIGRAAWRPATLVAMVLLSASCTGRLCAQESQPSGPRPGAAEPWAIPTDRSMTEQEQDALARAIRAAAEAGQKQQPAAGQLPRGAPVPAVGPGATTQPVTQPAQAKGCGGTSGPAVDLTPPPPDQPQPKFACPQLKVVSENVWQNQPVEFKFTITNEGLGPLAIRIRKL
jgi:hypothetical protein